MPLFGFNPNQKPIIKTNKIVNQATQQQILKQAKLMGITDAAISYTGKGWNIDGKGSVTKINEFHKLAANMIDPTAKVTPTRLMAISPVQNSPKRIVQPSPTQLVAGNQSIAEKVDIQPQAPLRPQEPLTLNQTGLPTVRGSVFAASTPGTAQYENGFGQYEDKPRGADLLKNIAERMDAGEIDINGQEIQSGGGGMPRGDASVDNQVNIGIQE